MFDRNWSVFVTSEDRYEFSGIDDFVIDHLKQQAIKKPVIIDVGCSTGIALKKTAKNIRKLEYDPHTIGIDALKKIKSRAEKNLDEFINQDVLAVDHREGIADVVICSKAAIFVVGERRSDIIRKCASFLKESGILIADVDCYPRRTFGVNIHKFLRYIWYQVPTLDCFKKGVKNCGREYARRANTTIKENVFKMSKDEALFFADEIIKGWKKRSQGWRAWWKFTIFILGLIFFSI